MRQQTFQLLLLFAVSVLAAKDSSEDFDIDNLRESEWGSLDLDQTPEPSNTNNKQAVKDAIESYLKLRQQTSSDIPSNTFTFKAQAPSLPSQLQQNQPQQFTFSSNFQQPQLSQGNFNPAQFNPKQDIIQAQFTQSNFNPNQLNPRQDFNQPQPLSHSNVAQLLNQPQNSASFSQFNNGPQFTTTQFTSQNNAQQFNQGNVAQFLAKPQLNQFTSQVAPAALLSSTNAAQNTAPVWNSNPNTANANPSGNDNTINIEELFKFLQSHETDQAADKPADMPKPTPAPEMPKPDPVPPPQDIHNPDSFLLKDTEDFTIARDNAGKPILLSDVSADGHVPTQMDYTQYASAESNQVSVIPAIANGKFENFTRQDQDSNYLQLLKAQSNGKFNTVSQLKQGTQFIPDFTTKQVFLNDRQPELLSTQKYYETEFTPSNQKTIQNFYESRPESHSQKEQEKTAPSNYFLGDGPSTASLQLGQRGPTFLESSPLTSDYKNQDYQSTLGRPSNDQDLLQKQNFLSNSPLTSTSEFPTITSEHKGQKDFGNNFRTTFSLNDDLPNSYPPSGNNFESLRTRAIPVHLIKSPQNQRQEQTFSTILSDSFSTTGTFESFTSDRPRSTTPGIDSAYPTTQQTTSADLGEISGPPPGYFTTLSNNPASDFTTTPSRIPSTITTTRVPSSERLTTTPYLPSTESLTTISYVPTTQQVTTSPSFPTTQRVATVQGLTTLSNIPASDLKPDLTTPYPYPSPTEPHYQTPPPPPISDTTTQSFTGDGEQGLPSYNIPGKPLEIQNINPQYGSFQRPTPTFIQRPFQEIQNPQHLNSNYNNNKPYQNYKPSFNPTPFQDSVIPIKDNKSPVYTNTWLTNNYLYDTQPIVQQAQIQNSPGLNRPSKPLSDEIINQRPVNSKPQSFVPLNSNLQSSFNKPSSSGSSYNIQASYVQSKPLSDQLPSQNYGSRPGSYNNPIPVQTNPFLSDSSNFRPQEIPIKQQFVNNNNYQSIYPPSIKPQLSDTPIFKPVYGGLNSALSNSQIKHDTEYNNFNTGLYNQNKPLRDEPSSKPTSDFSSSNPYLLGAQFKPGSAFSLNSETIVNQNKPLRDDPSSRPSSGYSNFNPNLSSSQSKPGSDYSNFYPPNPSSQNKPLSDFLNNNEKESPNFYPPYGQTRPPPDYNYNTRGPNKPVENLKDVSNLIAHDSNNNPLSQKYMSYFGYLNAPLSSTQSKPLSDTLSNQYESNFNTLKIPLDYGNYNAPNKPVSNTNFIAHMQAPSYHNTLSQLPSNTAQNDALTQQSNYQIAPGPQYQPATQGSYQQASQLSPPVAQNDSPSGQFNYQQPSQGYPSSLQNKPIAQSDSLLAEGKPSQGYVPISTVEYQQLVAQGYPIPQYQQLVLQNDSPLAQQQQSQIAQPDVQTNISATAGSDTKDPLDEDMVPVFLPSNNCTATFDVLKDRQSILGVKALPGDANCRLTFMAPDSSRLALQVIDLDLPEGDNACQLASVSVFSQQDGRNLLLNQLCGTMKSSPLMLTEGGRALVTVQSQTGTQRPGFTVVAFLWGQ